MQTDNGKKPAVRNDVAKLAGVAPSTVSHVLNGTKYVSEECASRVRNAIKKLEYEPSLLARSFKTKCTKQIEVYVNNPVNFGDIYSGMYSVAHEKGYSLYVVFATDDRVDYYHQSYLRRVDGIINLSRFFCGEEVFHKLQNNNIAIVNARQNVEQYEVSINYSDAVKKYVERLAEVGGGKFAFIADTAKENIVGDSRYNGIKYYLEQYHIPFDEDLLFACECGPAEFDSAEMGFRAMETIFKKAPDVRSVFCVNDLLALGAMKYLRKIGRRIPEDVSVCGCDDIFFGNYIEPEISSFSADKVAFGRICMLSILEQINGVQGGQKQHVLQAEFIQRKSV